MGAFAVSVLVKATLVVGAALGGVRLARGSRAAVRHLVLAAAFAVLLVLPPASFLAPSVRVAVPIAGSGGFVEPPPDAAAGEAAIGSTTSVSADAAAATAPLRVPSVAGLTAGAWMLGVVICLLPVGFGVRRVRAIRRSAIPWRDAQPLVDQLARDAGIRRRVDLVLSEAMRGPMTCGSTRPAIVLPIDARTWPHGDLQRAITHELEHVRRADWLTQSVTRAVCAAYWMHPLVWIASRQLALEAERACDDAVLRRRSTSSGEDADPAVYAEQLVALARRLSGAKRPPVPAMAARRDLATRVAALLDAHQRRGPAGTRWVMLAGGIAALLLAGISPLRIVAAEPRQAAASSAATVARFDAATIKPCSADEAPPGPARGGMGGTNASFSPGRMNVPCVTLEQLIYLAYAGSGAWPDNQLVNVVPGGASDDRKVRGGPAWVHSQHTKFAVEAAAAGASARNVLLGSMLRTLLEDRFELKIRRETEDVPMYAMTVAKGGLRIKPTRPGDCVAYDSATFNMSASTPTCGNLTMGSNGPNVVWKFNDFELQSLAYRLSSALNTFVIDRTDVTDKFMLRLEFHPDDSTPGIRWTPDREAESGAPQAASIFTALEQQVGVKIEKTRGPRGYLVIDHVAPLQGGR